MSRILADGVMAILGSPSVQRIRLVLGEIRMAKKLRKTYHRGSEDAESADRLGCIFASMLLASASRRGDRTFALLHCFILSHLRGM